MGTPHTGLWAIAWTLLPGRHSVRALQAAEQRREDVGVELYGYQQHLGRLHTRLGAAQKSTAEIGSARKAADQHIAQLRKESDAENQLTNKHRSEVGRLWL